MKTHANSGCKLRATCFLPVKFVRFDHLTSRCCISERPQPPCLVQGQWHRWPFHWPLSQSEETRCIMFQTCQTSCVFLTVNRLSFNCNGILCQCSYVPCLHKRLKLVGGSWRAPANPLGNCAVRRSKQCRSCLTSQILSVCCMLGLQLQGIWRERGQNLVETKNSVSRSSDSVQTMRPICPFLFRTIGVFVSCSKLRRERVHLVR